MLERGARSVAMIFRAIVFTFVPTAIELTGREAELCWPVGGWVGGCCFMLMWPFWLFDVSPLCPETCAVAPSHL